MFGILSVLPETNQGINGIWNTRKGKYSDIWGLGPLFSVPYMVAIRVRISHVGVLLAPTGRESCLRETMIRLRPCPHHLLLDYPSIAGSTAT